MDTPSASAGTAVSTTPPAPATPPMATRPATAPRVLEVNPKLQKLFEDVLQMAVKRVGQDDDKISELARKIGARESTLSATESALAAMQAELATAQAELATARNKLEATEELARTELEKLIEAVSK